MRPGLLRNSARVLFAIVFASMILSKLYFTENSFYARLDFVAKSLFYSSRFHLAFVGIAVIAYFIPQIKLPRITPAKSLFINIVLLFFYILTLYSLIMTQGLREDYFTDQNSPLKRDLLQEATDRDRFIAHSTGYPDGVPYTNSLEGLEYSNSAGFKYFEVDTQKTSDGHWVGMHDWEDWAQDTKYAGTIPPTFADFKSHKINGRFTPLDIETIRSWFLAHPDKRLITDKVNEPVEYAKSFPEKNRYAMELFDEDSLTEARKNDIDALISWSVFKDMPPYDSISQLKELKVDKIAMSRLQIKGRKRFLLQARNAGIKVYLFNIEDIHKSFCEEMGYAYGMYIGTWNFNQPDINCH
ncbi:MAG: hypothetical protein J7501_15655 [Bdellovibrio sp.]|nr:hypothetical protein [Bdellovibrio sp.]